MHEIPIMTESNDHLITEGSVVLILEQLYEVFTIFSLIVKSINLTSQIAKKANLFSKIIKKINITSDI